MIIRAPETPQEWERYYKLRYDVLRKPLGQPEGSEKNEGDAIGVHLALFDADDIVAIARLDQADINIGQVRFVAVKENTQGKGYGRAIMEAAEDISNNRGDSKLILQARENALSFYKKLGYVVLEKSYLLYGQVQHYLMEKLF